MLLQTMIRTILSIILLQILAKIIGPKQISQLTYYDYIVGITLGSIAAVMAIDDQVKWYLCAIAMILYIIISLFFAWITNKSIIARKVLTGVPQILIFHGKIIEKNLKKIHFDLNDLLTQCRSAGYFDISKIEYAIMETTGNVSFMLKSEENPITRNDMGKKVQQEQLFANVIIDGKIMKQELKTIGKNETWLQQRLKEKEVVLDDVLLGIADCNNTLHLYRKRESMNGTHYFL